MHMNRKDLVRKICSLVENSNILTLPQMESDACKTEEYKKGLYFLYDVNNVCIYVGKVGSGQTSLYHRMIGHAGGSHKQADSRWYPLTKYGKWYKFDLDGKELAFIERLAVYGMDQPIYNDCDTDEVSIKEFVENNSTLFENT